MTTGDGPVRPVPEPPARADGWPGSERSGGGPFAGLRVLDLSRVLAGPLASMQLADLGADVIKIEAPGRGDETRHFGPPFADDGVAVYYSAVNRSKRSLELDLASPRGMLIARRLALQADIMIDNFLPGRLSKFGLDGDELRLANPALITATVSGFGSNNAYSERPGFDFLAQAMGGYMAVTGQQDGEPTRTGTAVVDYVAGLYTTQGILAALSERKTTGMGRHVEVALLDTVVAMLANLGMSYLVAGVETDRFGNAHPSIAPYETLRVADGEIAVAVGTDRQFARLAAAVGDPDLVTDPRFVSNRERVRHRSELKARLEKRLTTRSKADWLEVLATAEVPVAPVNTIAEVFADPVVRERMVAAVDDVPQINSPVRLDGRPLPLFSRPPNLGEHNEGILSALEETDRDESL